MFKNYGDITKIDGSIVEPVDCIIGGSPCFPKGTLILTSKGFINIENVCVGDLVYTHKHRFRKVIATGSHEDTIISIKGNLSEFLCTPNHPIYSPDILSIWDKERHCYKRLVGDEKWVSACEMDHRYWQVPNIFYGFSDIENSVPVHENEAYFFGRWLGDGWCRVGKRTGRKSGTFAEIILCDSLDKEQELIKCCSCVTDRFSVERQKSCVRVKFHNCKLCNLLEHDFGHGTKQKRIPVWLLFSSQSCREALLKGLVDSDEHTKGNKIYYTTCSKELAFSVRLLGESLGYSTSLYLSKGKGFSLIDGRKVLRTDSWVISLVKNKKKPRFEYNGNSLYLVRKVSVLPELNRTVYNLSVEEDESYIADSIIVHNGQNLSIAGDRLGLGGSESSLFLHQIRLVQEMRVASDFLKPRYMVWENVTNALSCNKGKDFQRVLVECVNVAVKTQKEYREQQIPYVPMPKDGKWTKSGILYDDLGRWSIAWRIHDAQYWGVAQRRRRIALVVDFGGMSAPEVLFESKSVQGNLNQSNAQGKRITEGTCGSSTEPNRESNNERIDTPIVLDRASFNQGVNALYDPYIGKSETVPTLVSRGPSAVCYDARGNGDGKITATLTGDHDNRISDYTNVVVEQVSKGFDSIQSNPCICIGNGQSHVTQHYTKEIAQTLNCMHDPMTILEPNKNVYHVRRLTPLECTLLQGFPDHWVDIGEWVDSNGKKHNDSDTPKYKALGNSIALPFWKWLCKNIINEIKEENKDINYIPTMGSLFAGIGGFDLCWLEATENKDSVLWVSEIDEFPIAVMKRHFS